MAGTVSPHAGRWLLAGAADMVRDNAVQLAAYRDTLERLVAEPSAAGCPDGMGRRIPEPPLPGNAAAFGALMVIWEAVPRLEAALRLAVAGHPGLRRGGSARNFLDSLEAIPNLAAGLGEDGEAAAGRILDRLNNLARCIPDIDEAERWRLIRGRACPYCKCWAVKVLLDAAGRPTRHVECFSGPVVRGGVTVRCADGNGARPVATIGGAGLEWADGLVETVPDLED